MYVRTQRLVIRGAPAKNPRKNRPGARGGKGAGIAFVGGACAGTPPRSLRSHNVRSEVPVAVVHL